VPKGMIDLGEVSETAPEPDEGRVIELALG
jgi:hypothetical protein